MTKKELKQIQNEVAQQSLGIYAGILFNNQIFIEGNDDEIVYNFDCPELITLKEKYNLEEIAGKGTDFKKAKVIVKAVNTPTIIHLSISIKLLK